MCESILDIIKAKRNGQALNEKEIGTFIKAVVGGHISEGQTGMNHKYNLDILNI